MRLLQISWELEHWRYWSRHPHMQQRQFEDEMRRNLGKNLAPSLRRQDSCTPRWTRHLSRWNHPAAPNYLYTTPMYINLHIIRAYGIYNYNIIYIYINYTIIYIRHMYTRMPAKLKSAVFGTIPSSSYVGRHSWSQTGPHVSPHASILFITMIWNSANISRSKLGWVHLW